MTASALPGYVLEAVLGQGATGTVHLARRSDWAGRLVAVKRVPDATPGLARTLRHEAEVLAGLDHPHIVRILDLVPDGDGVAIAMQFAAGGSLPDLLARRGCLTPGQVVAIAAPMADALASAHRRGLLHCDVKPANVLFTSDGEPLLSDFGLARRMVPAGSPAGGGPVTGTAEYLDPVVAAGGHADQRSDVYGLGAVCYELLAGRPPHTGATPEAVLSAALAGPPPPLGPAAHGAPLALVQAVERAMARNPADRFPDAAAFATTLRAATPPTPITLADAPAGGAGERVSTDGIPPALRESPCSSRALHPANWPGAPGHLGPAPPLTPASGHLGPAPPVSPTPGHPRLAPPVTPAHRPARPTREFGPRPPRPTLEPTTGRTRPRAGLLVATAGLVAVLGGAAAVALAGAGDTSPAATAPTAAARPAAAPPRPCPATTGPMRADDDGDGCPSTVSWKGNVASVGVHRYQLGRSGDALLVGDWDCDARATPALYRPSTGEVFLFDSWAGQGPEVAGRDGGRGATNGVASVERDAGGCDRVAVRGPGAGPTRAL